jgi:hypothetical protein
MVWAILLSLVALIALYELLIVYPKYQKRKHDERHKRDRQWSDMWRMR